MQVSYNQAEKTNRKSERQTKRKDTYTQENKYKNYRNVPLESMQVRRKWSDIFKALKKKSAHNSIPSENIFHK